MRFSDFLDEHGTLDIQAALKRLEQECAPFLNEAGKVGLWRGLPRDAWFIPKSHKVTVASSRPPTHTDDKLHHLADDWFFDNFGFRARSNALFATGSKQQAAGYGLVHAVYPVGKYEYVWSPQVEDFYLWTISVFKPMLRKRFNLAKVGLNGISAEDLNAELRLALDHAGYIDTDMAAALTSQVEVMIRCDKFYAFSIHNETWQQWSGFTFKE